jgi:hypothetical protein
MFFFCITYSICTPIVTTVMLTNKLTWPQNQNIFFTLIVTMKIVNNNSNKKHTILVQNNCTHDQKNKTKKQQCTKGKKKTRCPNHYKRVDIQVLYHYYHTSYSS